MREMKDSGISWINEIPENWSAEPIKYNYSLIAGATPESTNVDFWDGNIKWITPADFKTKDVFVAGGSRNLTIAGYKSCSTSMLPIGSIVFSKRAPIGTVAITADKLCTNQGCLGLVEKSGRVLNKFYFYVISIYSDVFNLYGSGTTFKEISANVFANIKLPTPPIQEQQRIADFLDAKCAEIDALTADIQTQIDTLEQYKRSVITETVTKGMNPDAEMKDSGVFYMAPMNASWRLTKIGYICTKLSRSFVSEDTALICSNKGKVQVRADDLTGIMVSDDNAMQGIRAGDIAIHGMDTWHGAIALSEFDGKITRVVHVCDSTEDKRFIVYYMQHLAFQGVYKLISNGVRGNTSDFRSWDKVRDIWIAIPKTRQEQEAICDYLDRQCNAVEEVISTKKQQLEVLATYKKSLIFEYVTGKKEVPLS